MPPLCACWVNLSIDLQLFQRHCSSSPCWRHDICIQRRVLTLASHYVSIQTSVDTHLRTYTDIYLSIVALGILIWKIDFIGNEFEIKDLFLTMVEDLVILKLAHYHQLDTKRYSTSLNNRNASRLRILSPHTRATSCQKKYTLQHLPEIHTRVRTRQRSALGCIPLLLKAVIEVFWCGGRGPSHLEGGGQVPARLYASQDDILTQVFGWFLAQWFCRRFLEAWNPGDDLYISYFQLQFDLFSREAFRIVPLISHSRISRLMPWGRIWMRWLLMQVKAGKIHTSALHHWPCWPHWFALLPITHYQWTPIFQLTRYIDFQTETENINGDRGPRGRHFHKSNT